MGIAGLWNILTRMSKGLNRADYLNKKTVSVDISGLLYSYYYTSSDQERKNYHVHAAFVIITRILSLGLVPVFVFDSGVPHRLKSEELERRRRAETNLIKSTLKEVDADEYQRLEAEGFSDIMNHFSAPRDQRVSPDPAARVTTDIHITNYWSDSTQDIVNKTDNSSSTGVIRCATCYDMTPICFDQLKEPTSLPLTDANNTRSSAEDEVLCSSDDSFEFGADYNYEGTRLLLSHKLHFTSDILSAQLGNYANWQLQRRLAVSRMNEQVFTAIRQQRDAARLALIAAMSPHKVAERPSNELDMLPTHSIFDTSKDAEEYFSKLDVCDDHDANRSMSEDSRVVPPVTTPSLSAEFDWRESSSDLITLQDTGADTSWGCLANDHSRLKRLMTSGAVLGTTFSSFVNQSNDFPEVGVFKAGVYNMRKKLAGDTKSSVYKPLTDRVIAEVLQIATLFKVPCIKCKAGYEAEHVCALLNSHGYVAAVLTEDSDIIAYRPILVLRLFGALSSIQDVSGFQSIRQRDVSLYFSSDDIIFLALVMGCDFCDGIPSFGYVHTLELLLYLKYFVASDSTGTESHDVPIHTLIDRFRLYLLFTGLVSHPSATASQLKAHIEFVSCAHEVAIRQNWEKITAYRAQASFPIYFPGEYQAQTFVRELAQLRLLLNRRLWLRRDLLLRQLRKESPDPGSNNSSSSIFAKLTSKWNAVIKVFSQNVPVDEACTPISMGGRSLESLMQSVNMFTHQHIVGHLDMLTEGSDEYRPRIGEELQRLLGLPPLSIQACLQRTRVSFIRNREDINRVRVTELLSDAARRGSIFDFQPLGQRTFQSLRALFVLKTIYS